MSEIQLTVPLLSGFLSSAGYGFDSSPGHLNLMGLRSALPDGENKVRQVTDVFDRYNDTLIVFGRLGGDSELIQLFIASVDPGKYWTVHPSPKKGCAHLLNGQYLYQRGTHNRSHPKKSYPALVPDGPVKIWRDANRDARRDSGDFVETASFPINIHAGGTVNTVGMASAGCQVLRGGRDGTNWVNFWSRIKRSPQNSFRYTLLDAADLIAYNKKQTTGAEPMTANDLPPAKAIALQQVLSGFRLLYSYEADARLGGDHVTFMALLNRLRHSGVLSNLKLEDPPKAVKAASEAEARATLLTGFRLIYANMIDAGLDHSFHSQLNQLRRFGPLANL